MPKVAEDGNDDCGEDLKGLVRGACYTDVPWAPTPTVTAMRKLSSHYQRGFLRMHMPACFP
eukprot:4521111-Pyramimonas_sp.AAC.1